jgi:hypothetical protein
MRLLFNNSRKKEGDMSDQDASYNTEYKSITVRTTDGSTINGKVNISPDQRVSELFTQREVSFIVMVDVVLKDAVGKTRFINKDHIVWVEPDDS